MRTTCQWPMSMASSSQPSSGTSGSGDDDNDMNVFRNNLANGLFATWN